jgi:hypothetical protein
MNTLKENEEKFLKLANDLAIYFPDYLLHTPEGHWNVYFEHKSEPSKGFYLNPNNSTGKFTVSPKIVKTPHHSFSSVYNESGVKIESPTAGFSIDREAEAIAKGIKTRFMPGFEIYYAAWISYWQKQEDYKNGRNNAIREIAKVAEVGDLECVSHNGELREVIYTGHSANEKFRKNVSTIRVSSKDSIHVEVSYLNMDKARKLIEFLKTL